MHHARTTDIHNIHTVRSHAGVLLASSEMALFQLAKDAKAPAFKAVSALAKEARQPAGPLGVLGQPSLHSCL